MISSNVKKWLEDNNILELTSVQKQAIPPIREKKNVLITAPTGYGKTLAAIIPLFEILIEEKCTGLNILYIAPTKSLNRDIFKRVISFAEHLGLTISVRHGDTTASERAKQVKKPPNILVTTPESLQSMLISPRMRANLSSLKFVVVDEIHELVPSKRGAQLTLGLERLNLITNYSRIGISATISDMKEVSKFLCGDRECEIVQISEPKESKVEVLKPKSDNLLKELAKKLKIGLTLTTIMESIRKDLESAERAIIFVNTRQQAEVLAFSMNQAYSDIKIGLHHSSLSKKQRIDVETALKDGSLKALIATSSMELGIDVGSVDLVVQFMSPRQVNKLVQRVGRSGHAYYKKSYGRIYTLNDDDYLESKAIVELMKEGFLEKPLVPFNSMDVLAHQIIGFVKDNTKISKTELLNAVNRSYCFNLSREELDDLLRFLEELGYIQLLGERISLGAKSFYYYFENVSTIPDMKNYKIVNVESNSRIGTLDESFVLQYCNPGATIIMRGEPWDVLEVEADTISVGRARSFSGAVPSWAGELIPVSRKVAERVQKLREEHYTGDNLIPPDCFYVETFENNIIIHSCYGSNINNTLGTLFSSMISARIGSSIGLRTDPYRVILTVPPTFSLNIFREINSAIKPEIIPYIIKLSAKNTTLFHMRFFNVGQRFGIIRKGAEYIGSRINKIVEMYSSTPIFTETLNEIIREKMSIEEAQELFKTLKFEYSKKSKVSSIGFAGVNFGGFSGIFKSAESYEEIYAIVKERLLSKVFKFKCSNCKTVLGNFSVNSFPFEKCPKCSAKNLGFAPTNREVNAEWWDETGNLFLTYGKKACFVLAAYGIGVRTGKRVLSNMTSEKELIKNIISEEKNFVRTRRFWN